MPRRLSRDGHAPLNGERVCGCGTVLCQYNPSDDCWQHGHWETEEEKAAEAKSDEVLRDDLYHAALVAGSIDAQTGAPA